MSGRDGAKKVKKEEVEKIKMSPSTPTSQVTKRPEPVFLASRPDTVSYAGICTVFTGGGVVDKGNTRECHLHDAFAQGINIYQLSGRGSSTYVVWSVADRSSSRAFIRLFKPFLDRPGQDFLYREIKTLVAMGPNEVFVERTNGGPYEKYMSLICSGVDHRRAISLFVAFFGTRNSFPCDCCMRRMSQNFTISTTRGTMPVMIPFFECRSIPEISKGACANCIWHVEGSLCSFNRYSMIKEIQQGAAVFGQDPSGMPESELTLGKTTQVSQELSFDQARKESLTAAHGFRPNPRDVEMGDPKPWIPEDVDMEDA